MPNIRVDLDYTIKDGTEIKFRSPVDCSQITGLIVYYPGANGNTTSKEFVLADAHGNNVGDIDHLFAEDVVVKVILDVTKGMAFVQNADTNAYLEGKFRAVTMFASDPNNDGNIVLSYGGDVVPGGGGSGGSGGTVTDKQIASAVEAYMAEHPVSGLSSTEKNLMLTLFRNAVYTSADMGKVLTQLEALWSGGEVEPDIPDVPDVPDEPVVPEATLSSISATYSGGEVTEGTAVTDLTGIVVTAHYSDGSTATVTDYTLSGTIAEGSNTITVSYGGKTTTFTVNGTVEESKAVNLMTTGDLGIFSDLGVYTGYTGYYDADAETLQLTVRSEGTNKNAHLKITPFVEAGKTYTLFADCVNRTVHTNSLEVDYSTTTSFANGGLANTENVVNNTYTYAQFTVPTDAVEVYLQYTTTTQQNTTVTNVALYEGALTERP